MTLTELLNAALAAGVPMEALEDAGFCHFLDDPDEWSFYGATCDRGYKKDTGARLAAERIVIERLRANAGAKVWVHLWWDGTGDEVTLSAALTAALRQIKEVRDDRH